MLAVPEGASPSTKPKPKPDPTSLAAAPQQQAATEQPPLTVPAALARAAGSGAAAGAGAGAEVGAAAAAPQQAATAIQEILATALKPFAFQIPTDTSLANPGLGGGISAAVGDENPQAEDLLNLAVEQQGGAKGQQARAEAEDGRALRERALGTPGKEQRVLNQLRQLSPEEYDALTEQQRAAYDFNKMLAQAVHKDRRNADRYNPTPEEQASYSSDLEAMFGPGRDQGQYAPETVALLRQLGMQDPDAALSDFLSLDAAIGRKQIDRLAESAAPAPAAPGVTQRPGLGVLDAMDPVKQERFNLADSISADVSKLEQVMAKGNQMLSTIDQVAAQDRNDLVDRYGGMRNKLKPDVGYDPNLQLDENKNPVDDNSYFQMAFDLLAQRGTDPDAVLSDARRLMSGEPETLRKFLAYLDQRAANAERFGLPLGQSEDYLTPEEFRARLKKGGA